MLEFSDDRARLLGPAGADRGLCEKHHAAETLDGVIARVRGIEDSYERVECFRVATRGQPAVAARNLHDREERVEPAAPRQLLDLARECLGSFVVSTQTCCLRFEKHDSCLPEGLARLACEPSRLGFRGLRGVPAAEVDMLCDLEREHVRQQSEPSLLTQH